MEVLKKIFGYITFKKQDEGETTNFNLKTMHVINKISILVFLLAITFLIVRNILR